MTNQLFEDIYDKELAKDAIINDRHTGHKNDYLVLHILLKKYKPKTFFEIGTNTGFGTLIIKNALGANSTVYSLDLRDEDANKSKQHPLSEGKKGVGYECTLPYIQLRGDSRLFDYLIEPCEGYFIDGEHTYDNVYIETSGVVLCKPNIIIWHDADVTEVYSAIVNAMVWGQYDLFKVTDTRIMYALKRQAGENIKH